MEHGTFPSQSVNYIQSTQHTPSSFGNSINNGGIVTSDLQNNYHIYSLNWSPFQISFLIDNVIYYTYNPTVKDANSWPFDKEQFLLLNVAMGGVAGTILSNFTQAAINIDYVRIFQNTSVECSGTDTLEQHGLFSVGYNYTFETIGTDVKITFELLDTNRVGLVAFLW